MWPKFRHHKQRMLIGIAIILPASVLTGFAIRAHGLAIKQHRATKPPTVQASSPADMASTTSTTRVLLDTQSSKRTKTTSVLDGFVVMYDGGTSLYDWQAHQDALHSAILDGATLRPDGSVLHPYSAAIHSIHVSNQHHMQICVSNFGQTDFDSSELRQIFASAKRTARLEQAILTLANSSGISGINIDFEQLPGADKTRFISFLTYLSQHLHKLGKTLSVDVPAITANDTWDAGYDIAAIGQQADEVIVMTYDYSYPGGPAGPIAPTWWVNEAMQYATHAIPKAKIRLGLPLYGYDWQGNNTTALSLAHVATLQAQVHAVTTWDSKASEPYFSYVKSGLKHIVYFENAASLHAKLDIARKYGVGGIAIWRIGSETPDLWSLFQHYITESP